MDWVEEEFAQVDLGDKRIDERLRQVIKKLSANPSDSIPTACGSWKETKAAYRLFDHEEVTVEKILKPHQAATLERMRAHETILLLQDTTTLILSSQKARKDIGPIQQNNVRGILLHPTLAITPERLCLGVVSSEQWYRETVSHESKAAKNKRNWSVPIEEKESNRWLNGYRTCHEYAVKLPGKRVVSVFDREGDIYELYEEAQRLSDGQHGYWLTRMHHNRVELSNKEHKARIKETTKQTEPLGEIRFVLPKHHPQGGREVKQVVRVKKVQLGLPDKYKKPKDYQPVEVTVVIATEVNAPVGVEPIEWVLLTNLPVTGYEQACEIIEWYTCRWEIEIYFKILKSGCKIEKLQLTDNNFNVCLSLYMIIAWRILYLTMIGRVCPELPCDCVLGLEEWKTAFIVAKQAKPPAKALALNEMIRIIASLGGYMNRRSDPMPGVKALWIGLRNLQEHVKAIEAFSKMTGYTYG